MHFLTVLILVLVAAVPLPVPLPVMPAAAMAAGVATATDAADACADAVIAAEREVGIPQGLLWAIALAESGRYDRRRQERFAWPWTINAEGEGHFFGDKGSAIAAVRTLRDQGVRSIDVGCMQVNLHHHPDAFASLEEAFEPRSNARYAGRFLRSLYEQTGSWPAAAGRYHSATPERGIPYRERVLALWNGNSGDPGAATPAIAAPGSRVEGDADAPSARGRHLIAPIDYDRMARLLLARRNDRIAVSGSPTPSSLRADDRLAGRMAPFDRYFASPTWSGGRTLPVRDARAEAAFAERRAESLRQWRDGGKPVRLAAGVSIVRGSLPLQATLPLR